MVASFLSISGRLRRPSLAPNVWYVIRKYAKIPWYTLLKIWCWHNTFRGVNKPFKYNTPRVLWEGVG